MAGETGGCTLCPRMCGADRVEKMGRCGMGRLPVIARAALHNWEEPCLSGTRGSGTVFFSGCPLGCVYCQNRGISRGKAGKEVSVSRLAGIFLALQSQGAHNINLVTPTHFTPQVAEALRLAKERGLSIPVVCNSGGYERVETLKMLDGLVDIYLPDFKYASPELAERFSGAADYPDTAKAAIREMVGQRGAPVFDEEGMICSGVIVRHLVLPGSVADSKAVIAYLHETYGEDIVLSIMNQYTPNGQTGFPQLERALTEAEYDEVVQFAIEIGVEQAYIQDGGTVSESFIPPFDLTGV